MESCHLHSVLQERWPDHYKSGKKSIFDTKKQKKKHITNRGGLISKGPAIKRSMEIGLYQKFAEFNLTNHMQQ